MNNKKIIISLTLITLSTNIQTTYAFQSKALEKAIPLIGLIGLSIILGIAALIATLIIAISKEENKLERIGKWWIAPIITLILPILIAYLIY